MTIEIDDQVHFENNAKCDPSLVVHLVVVEKRVLVQGPLSDNIFIRTNFDVI